MGREDVILEKLDSIEKSLAKMETAFEVRLGSLEKNQIALRVSVAGLQVKAGVWGAVAGMIPAGVAILYWVMQ